MKKIWMICIMATLGLSACGAAPVKITQADLLKRQAEKADFLLLDVRSALEYKRGYIEGAKLIPHGELAARADELKAFKDKEIVVYCQSGVRSGKAIGVLQSQGFSKVVQLDGDYGAWLRAGKAVVKP